MTDRILDLATQPAYLSIRQGLLVLRGADGGEETLPLSEVAVIVAANPQVTLTQNVLGALMAAGGVFIATDPARMPAGMMLPYEGHHLHAERLRLQVEASEPTRKQAWRQVVRAKVLAQGALLRERLGDDRGFATMAARVRSGDPDNVEAQAARRYWPLLFGPEFRRDREAPGANALLNYGYMVLRGIVARAVVAAGLHPALGIQHSNRYNAFSLVDDLMEPYRPLVDRAVCAYLDTAPAEVAVEKETKRLVLAPLLARHTLDGEARTLFDCAANTAVSLVQYLSATRKHLAYPDA